MGINQISLKTNMHLQLAFDVYLSSQIKTIYTQMNGASSKEGICALISFENGGELHWSFTVHHRI
ncbi:hypothetical protein VCHA37P191_120062 [Vibrio chagasii]|nr:hypothetical protein VCHA37P191_120062 [Vibrio chagasii]CAH6951730.1 hypothetical protein VCHA49P380_130062 [Vibrio chagasii]